jgi:hypothetical protein
MGEPLLFEQPALNLSRQQPFDLWKIDGIAPRVWTHDHPCISAMCASKSPFSGMII